MMILMKYEFKGNIRELENIIEHAYVLCRGGLIHLQHLPLTFQDKAGSGLAFKSGMTLKALETIHILDAIRRHQGNRLAAAKELGINPSTLFRKVKALKIKLMAVEGQRHLKK